MDKFVSTEGFVLGQIAVWEPHAAPHCSSCRWAKVQGKPEEPTVSCAWKHGPGMKLVRLIKPKMSKQFQPAARCEHFETTDEDITAIIEACQGELERRKVSG